MATATLTPVKSELCCLNHEGDKRLMWDPSNGEELKEAEATFDDYKKKGYMAYRVNKKGEEGAVIDSFDPSAERIIMRPQMVGG